MPSPTQKNEEIVIGILLALSASHMINDMSQSLLQAIYPIVKDSFALSFTQIGIITLAYQLTASILQPFVGLFTDKRPLPYSLCFGMASTMSGLITLAYANSFHHLLLGAMLLGTGSSIFHPESSRMARTASGGRYGFAQSSFQIGGNAGTAIGPLLAAYVILPHGQQSIAWFASASLVAIVLLAIIGRWYTHHHLATARSTSKAPKISPYSKSVIIRSIVILLLLIFSKYFYMASLGSYYTFYLIERFNLDTHQAQLYLFAFLAAVAAGTFAGGPLGDNIGRKYVIWGSILGVLPFTLALPYANLFWTGILSVVIGCILASAFSAIIVYAQELIPGRTGMVAGLFFGFAFGMGGIGAAIFGTIADHKGIEYVYHLASYLPAIGILTIFLPNTKKHPR